VSNVVERNIFALRKIVRTVASLAAAAVLVASLASTPAHAKEKKNVKATPDESAQPKQRNILEGLDTSKLVWPNPPAITRIKYLNYWSGEKYVAPAQQKKKSSWMERVAGVATGATPSDFKPRWQLVVPNGVAVDSKNRIYIADSKVRAIFVINSETGEYKMIRNGSDANFKWLTGLAIDDSDRLFAADSGMKRVIIFDANHKVEGQITQNLYDPGGVAVDNENRLLYVTDAEQDLVLVFDADSPYKLIRTLGKAGTKHTSTLPGEFAKPTGVAVDQDNNVYVSDTWNNRIEVFDADGRFIRAFGKAGDGPGYFARPKGIAIDSDGHVWVADGMQDRVQVYTPEGKLLIWMGGHGLLPGWFQSLVGLTIDKNNRVITSEQYPGRVQIFRYTTQAEAKSELDRRNAEAEQKKAARAVSAPATAARAQGDKKD
jgi:DNA-binding beta-propeller fold protein YncE